MSTIYNESLIRGDQYADMLGFISFDRGDFGLLDNGSSRKSGQPPFSALVIIIT
jgi:hypothetical protein